jgi:glycosyltransferase involved in cell wall biosynthesis
MRMRSTLDGWLGRSSKGSFRNGKLLVVMFEAWGHVGGIQQVNRSLIRLFARSDQFRDTLVLSLMDSQDDVDVALTGTDVATHLEVVGFSSDKKDFSLAFLESLVNYRPAVILFSHITLATLGLMGKLLGYPYIFIAHGIEVWKRPSILTRLTVRLASHSLAVSEHTKKVATTFDRAFDRLQVCPLGLNVDTSLDTEVYSSLRDTFVGKKIILIVARIDAREAYKGHLELIRAMRQISPKHPDARLVIVGQGSGVPFLKDVVQSEGLEEFVVFAGFISDRLLNAYYALCEVFAMPSRGEGFGLAYLGAMAHGKPCIGSRVDAAREVIADGETGFLVDPSDERELADCINLLLRDAALRKEMGQAGRVRYESLFTEEEFHNRLTVFFQSYFDRESGT